ncbi:MAG: RtcB family protein [Flavobacteriaceae bacterium]|nr:MAG: RtcB family protein [Flavobacteriaceae bacterium]
MKPLEKSDIVRLSHFCWEIPSDFKPGMRVPARIIAEEALLDDILGDRSLQQLVNVTTLPGILKAAFVMPDVHEGYGFPIGGVAATAFPHGAISPGGIGYDINCGVRLLKTPLKEDQIREKVPLLVRELFAQIPSGMGTPGHFQLTEEEMNSVLLNGSRWALQRGYATESDLEHTESNGCLPGADPLKVSQRARQRGRDQLGTIGSGNHFVEVGYVDRILEPDIARGYGLFEGQVTILIHTGSRGLGHQVATDYIRVMLEAMTAYDIKLPDRELACVPFDSQEGQDYFGAMCAAANFAWCNRQVVTWEVHQAWKNIFGPDAVSPELLYDVAHNIAKVETHEICGETQKVVVHRKGATRAFGPWHEEIPAVHQPFGQAVLIPGSMGTSSYVLAGAEGSAQVAFGSCCHGAGRRLSRTAAKKQVNAPVLKEELEAAGIYLEASYRRIAEEAPIAYKDVDTVVRSVSAAGIVTPVAQLRPLAAIKG